MTLVRTLIGALVAGGAFFLVRWVLEARRISSERSAATGPGPTPLDLVIGFVTNFFDTLGIGSFATTTAAFRLFRLVPDELIPGTIIVGDALAVLTQAVLFISVVEVDPLQLTALIAVCVAGGWIGTGIVTRLSRRAIQLGIGTALIVAAVFMAFGLFGLTPAGGTARALTPAAFVLALAINFALGALLPLGIGNYAPSLVVFSLLGMDLRAAFPIMMGSGAFVATVAGVRFLSRTALPPAGGARTDARRHSRRDGRRVARQVPSTRSAAGAGPRRRRVRVSHPAAIGDESRQARA